MVTWRSYHTWISTSILLISALHPTRSQNIVHNPGFEDFTACPSSIGDGDLECHPWQNGNCATTDYYNTCATSVDVGIPANWVGYQDAHEGKGYLGFICKWTSEDWQEFPQARLMESLVAGYTYEFTFYLSLANEYCGIRTIGVHFSRVQPPDSSYCGPLDAIPQWETNQGYLSDTVNWMPIRGCFIAEGGESWMTIGNFHLNEETMTDPFCGGPALSYYLIDDVSVIQLSEAEMLDLDLGDNVTVCDEYLIDPGIVDDVNYTWSDGSHEETLLVTESGNYQLTITSPGCTGYAIDSVEVTILGVPDTVFLGPDSVVICEGESYDIELDPDFGEYEWQDGSDDTEYSITETGLYQVTLDDGCDESSDQVYVTVVPPPLPFSLGPDELLCQGEQIIFSFDPSLGSFEWQDGSVDPVFTIVEEGEYSLTISNMCGEYEDEMEVEDLEPPLVDLDDEPLILCDGDFITIAVDDDQGEYVWQDGSNDTDYEIDVPGTYYVTVTNECGTANDSAFVVLVQEPIFYLGPDQYLCSSQFPFLISPGDVPHAVNYIWDDGSAEDSLWVETPGIYHLTVSNECFAVSDEIEIALDGEVPVVALPADQLLCPGQTFVLTSNVQTGTFLWQDGSTGSAYTVQSAGTYYLAVTNDCGTGTDTIVVNYTAPVPSPDLGPDLSFCPGEQIVLSTAIANVNYLWQDGSVNDSLLVNAAGTYILQVADQCTAASDTIVITSNNVPPQVNLPATLAICQGDSVIINAGISGVSYTWSDGSQLAQLTAFTPGTYSITVSNACGADADSVIVTDNGVAPTVSLGNDLSFCTGESALLNPASTEANTWLWQDGSSLPSLLVADAGLYAVTVTNNCGAAQDTLEVTLLPTTPLLSLGPDLALCPDVTFTLTIPVPGVDVLWSNGSTSMDLTVTAPDLISAEITNGCGVSYDTILISVLPAAPELDLGQDQSLCVGETIVIDPDVTNVFYLWQDGSTTPVYLSTQEETIILVVTNSCGSDVDTLEVMESTDGPQVDLGPDVVGCVGDTVVLASNISGVDFEWNDGSVGNDLQVLQSGTYTLAVSNLCGEDIDTVMVLLSGLPPIVSLGSDTAVCEGTPLILTAAFTPGAEITWQDGSIAPNFLVTNEGNYSITALNECGEDADTLIVTHQYPPENFTLGADTVLCPGDFVVLVVPLVGYDVLWQNGSTANSIVADQDAIYTLTLSNHCGSTSDDLEVTLDQRTPVINLDETYPWCEGDVITLNVLQSFPASYVWSNGSVSASITIVTPGVYSVEVSSDCLTLTDEVTVVSVEPCVYNGIYIPNVISPNGDGINDVFSVFFGSDITVLSLSGAVYDRWGNLLFASDQIPFSWDGKRKGELMNPGVYVYTILVRYVVDGRTIEVRFTGDVTIVR